MAAGLTAKEEVKADIGAGIVGGSMEKVNIDPEVEGAIT
jgi:hypothetical protein